MAYADRPQMSNSRIAAIVIVALLHALLGYAFVTGLAYNVVKKVAADLKTFDVEEEPPPPEEEPPPPPDQPDIPPPPSMPPPIIRPQIQQQTIQTVEQITPPAPPPQIPVVAAPPPPPPPPPPKVVTKAQSASGNLQGLFSSDDYPPDAVRNEDQGTVTVRLSISPQGRVTGCTVTGSSGSRSLDNATCRILRSRARFTPAKMSDGTPTNDTYTQRITWRLEG